MKKKLLILTPRFPYPVIGGDRLRIYNLCNVLSEKFELTLLSLCESQAELSYPVDDVFASIERIYMPKWRSYMNCLLHLCTKTPLQVAYYRNKQFKKKLQTLIESNDLVLAHLVRTGDYLKEIKKPKILEMTDAISLNYQRVQEMAKSSGLKNIIYSLEQKRLKKYEQIIVENFDASILVSQLDKDYLFSAQQDCYTKVHVCSNGVDTHSLSYDFSENSKQLIFIGNLFSVQNMDAAYWFAKYVMPKLLLIDNFTFKIIGQIKESDRRKFDNLKGIILTGRVDSVADESRHSLAGICSVRLGAGVQNKILEYMSLGIPCITSTTGLEGIEAKPDVEILVADTIDEYISMILRLVNNTAAASLLAESGRQFVVREHSWHSKLEKVVELVDQLVV